MQNRHRRLAAISGAVLILGSLMASAAPAVVAQEDAALCQLPDGFKVGIATREMVNDSTARSPTPLRRPSRRLAARSQ